MTTDEKSIDALGLKSFGEATKIATQGAVDGVAAFFGRICLPAAEEFGLLLRDRVHDWRAANVAAMAQRAEALLENKNVHASPRLVSQVVEESSWIDDPYLQSLWAGLLASSCTEGGDDDSNLMFLNILSGLTRLQCQILKYACENAPKHLTLTGLPFSKEFRVDVSTLTSITGCIDIERIDREMDHLRGLELIHGGFDTHDSPDHHLADIAPTAIALHMFVRCNGSRKSPTQYFDLTVDPDLLPKRNESDTNADSK